MLLRYQFNDQKKTPFLVICRLNPITRLETSMRRYDSMLYTNDKFLFVKKLIRRTLDTYFRMEHFWRYKGLKNSNDLSPIGDWVSTVFTKGKFADANTNGALPTFVLIEFHFLCNFGDQINVVASLADL